LCRFREQLETAQEAVTGQSEEAEKQLKIIGCMTPEELANPDVLLTRAFKARQRIATAAAVEANDINRLV
jgi:signal recognition particle GTPase